MRNFNFFSLLSVALFMTAGCSEPRGLPDVTEIKSINLSLNDPATMSYWTFEGDVPEKHWSKLLEHLTTTPYKGGIAKWQGLGVIRIYPSQGDEFSIEVYLTGDAVGCYKLDGHYLTIDDENAFYEDGKRFLHSDSNEVR